MKQGNKMKNIKIIISLLLIFTLPTISFAGYSKKRHHHKPSPSRYHNHHRGYYYDRYYYSDTSARNAIFVLLGITAITAVAVAATKSAKKEKQKPKKETVQEQYEQVSQDLTLSKEQQEKVKQLFDTNRAKIAPLRDEKFLKTMEFEQEKSKENPDKTIINNLENEISNLSMNIYRIIQDTKKELQTILTPAQYETMQDLQL